MANTVEKLRDRLADREDEEQAKRTALWREYRATVRRIGSPLTRDAGRLAELCEVLHIAPDTVERHAVLLKECERYEQEAGKREDIEQELRGIDEAIERRYRELREVDERYGEIGERRADAVRRLRQSVAMAENVERMRAQNSELFDEGGA